MKQDLISEIKNNYKMLFKKRKNFNIFSILSEINFKNTIIIIIATIFLYLAIFFFSKMGGYIPFLFIDLKEGLKLKDLSNIIINIEIGIFTIFFSLVVLIASYIYYSNSEEGKKILLGKSLIFPLIIYNLLLLLSFTLNGVFWDGYLQIIPLTINIFFIIISLFKIFRIITQKDILYKESRKLLFNKIKNFNKDLLLERLAKNFNYHIFNLSDINISYNIFSNFPKDIIIISTSKGVIKNIILSDLKKEIINLNRINDFKKATNKIDESIPENSENVKKQKKIEVFINRSIGDYIDESTELIFIKLNNINIKEININRIQSNLNKCFKVKNTDTAQKQLDSIFLEIEDEFIFAIKNKKRKDIENYKDLYIQLTSEFTELISPVGLYNYENAYKERSSILGGWENIRLIIKSIQNCIVEAIELDDIEIIIRIISIPYNVLIDAANAGDHYIFQEFSNFIKYLYYFSNKYKEKKNVNICYDRALRYPQDISNLYLSRLINNSDIENINDNKKFSIPLLKAYQDILKDMIENNIKIEDFIESLQGFQKMFNSLYYQIREDDNIIFYDLQNQSYKDFNKLSIKDRVFGEIQIDKYIIILGLANFILKKNNYQLNDFSKKLLDYLPKNIDYFTYIFDNAIKIETEIKWEWFAWESKPYNDSFFSGDVDFDLYYIYILFVLKYITDFSNKKYLLISNDLNYYIYNNDSKLLKILSNIENSKIANNLTGTEKGKINDLLKYFEELSNRFNEEKNKIIANSLIDKNLYKKFHDDIFDTYENSFSLKKIYTMVTQRRKSDINGIKTISGGYNQIIDKEPYIKGSQGVIGDYNFAIGLRDFENDVIFKNWIKNLSVETPEDILKFLDDFLVNKKDFIILCTYKNTNNIKSIFNNNFTESWKMEKKPKKEQFYQIIGYYNIKTNNVTVYNISLSNISFQERIFLININSIGELIEIINDDNNEKLFFQLIDLNADDLKRQELITKKLDWLEKISDKDNYLKTKVLFKLFTEFYIQNENIECFEIKPPNKIIE